MAYVATIEGKQYIKVFDTTKNSYRMIGNICGLKSATANGDVIVATVEGSGGRLQTRLYDAKTGNFIKTL